MKLQIQTVQVLQAQLTEFRNQQRQLSGSIQACEIQLQNDKALHANYDALCADLEQLITSQ